MEEEGTSVFLVSPQSHGSHAHSVPDSSWEATLVAEMPREFEVPVDGSPCSALRHPGSLAEAEGRACLWQHQVTAPVLPRVPSGFSPAATDEGLQGLPELSWV